MNCPAVAKEDAPKTTDALCPATTEKAPLGLTVIPEGMPVRVMATGPVKLEFEVIEIVIGAVVAPSKTVTVELESAIVKSG